jgi:phosphatidylglycerol:prolipoprotein diacylglycerol transferase
MLQFPNFNPIAVSVGPFNVFDKTVGPLEVHWYGIMYMLAFLSAWLLALYRSGRPHSPIHKVEVENLVTYGAFGVILGGRIGYVIFYNFDRWMSDPLWLFRIWEGGMSFHGGLIGVLIAMYVYSTRIRVPYFALMDFVAPIVPLGLGFGRIGNFIGQELWGRVSDVQWAMVFPKAEDPIGITRHPSQLYQATLEGLVMFVVLFWFSAKPRPRGAVSGLFLVLYSSFRTLVENFREPDIGVPLVFDVITRGQLLSAPMFIFGVWLLGFGYYRERKRNKLIAIKTAEMKENSNPLGAHPTQEGDATEKPIT